MTEFNTLFQRNSDGSVQTWKIFVDGNRFWTESSKLNGKVVTSEKTAAEPKNVGRSNETTGEQQALLEAQARYKKKTETGYSETLEGIDDTGYVEPMLAKKYKDYRKKVTFPTISTIKLDGVRLNASDEGLISRKGKPFLSTPHIAKAMEPLYKKHPEYVFDGELFNEELKSAFNTIISLVRKRKPKPEDMQRSEDLIKFYIFDLFRKDGKDVLTAFERKLLIKEMVEELNQPCIVALDFTVCNSTAELDALYMQYVEDGHEGQMINLYDAVYEKKRTTSILKRKEFDDNSEVELDEEFEIVDVVEGRGGRKGCGILIVRLPNGSTARSAIKGDVAYMREVFSNKKQYIGQPATIRFQGYTEDGSLRFPRTIAIRDYE